MEIGDTTAAEADQAAFDALSEVTGASDGSTGSDVGASADAGVSPDAQAQIDHANERARVATRGQGLADSFAQTILGARSIDPGAGVVVNQYFNSLHPSAPAIRAEVASWLVGSLGMQGAVQTSAFSAQT